MSRRTKRSDGSMPLAEHLRELRTRIIRSAYAIAAGMVVAWYQYARIFGILRRPFDEVVAASHHQGIVLALNGVADPFTLQVQVSAVGGAVLAMPVWLYQLWRFITPGLHRHERRWALAFVAAAVPLFAAGAWLAYATLPVGLRVLFGFTPTGVENIISVDRYMSFFFQMLLVFGVGFLAPLVLVVLNFAGLVRGRTMLNWWRGIVMGSLVFGALATPTGDPVNMALIATPVAALLFAAIGVAMLNDRSKRRLGTLVDANPWADDEASPID